MKLPWEKDPDDLEAAYQKPVPRSEVLRTGSKIVCAALVGAWLWFTTRDRCVVDQVHDVCRPVATEAGAKLVLAVGAVATVLAAIDLVYLRRHEIELIFARTRSQQVAGRAVLLGAGLLALAAGTARLL